MKTPATAAPGPTMVMAATYHPISTNSSVMLLANHNVAKTTAPVLQTASHLKNSNTPTSKVNVPGVMMGTNKYLRAAESWNFGHTMLM